MQRTDHLPLHLLWCLPTGFLFRASPCLSFPILLCDRDIVPMGMGFPILGVSTPCHEPWCLTTPCIGFPLNDGRNPWDSPNISLACLRYFLHALQGSLLSSAGAQEQSLRFGFWDSASAFPCFLPGWYSTSNSNLDRASIHLATLCFGPFRLNSHFRALQSQCTLKHQPSK